MSGQRELDPEALQLALLSILETELSFGLSFLPVEWGWYATD